MPRTIPERRVKRVLVIAYVFPPAGGAGVQRVSKFVRYLPECDWECSVLTVANPSVPVFDQTLVDEIPDNTVVRRTPTFEPGYAMKNAVSAGTKAEGSLWSPKQLLKKAIRAAGNAILQPDAQVLWYPKAVCEGRRLLDELHHDAIFVTAPPFSSLLIGASLSRSSGLPLIVDYRDEWGISNRYQENRQKSSLSRVIQERMQRRVLRQAKAVIATTRRSADSLKERIQSSGSRATVSHIYNGYDAADLRSESTELPRDPDGDRYRISYVGTLWNLTDISPLVRGIRELAAKKPDLAAKLELVVAGRRTGEQESVLDELKDLPCRLTRKGYLSHGEAISVMRSSDELALLLSDVPESPRVVPAKTFEYLALKRNILAISPQGEMTEILASCPMAESFLPCDTTGIARHLERRLTERSSAPSGESDWEPSRFERRHLTTQLANVLNFAAAASAGTETRQLNPLEVMGGSR
jgi:glycosyltransferase involved in cell wall biosynthesis